MLEEAEEKMPEQPEATALAERFGPWDAHELLCIKFDGSDEDLVQFGTALRHGQYDYEDARFSAMDFGIRNEATDILHVYGRSEPRGHVLIGRIDRGVVFPVFFGLELEGCGRAKYMKNDLNGMNCVS